VRVLLTDKEFVTYCQRLRLSPEAIDVITSIRQSAPSRLVQATHVSSPTRYYSSKMGWSLGAESRTVEAAFYRAFDDDDDIIEIWDQPPKVWLRYRSGKGRALSPIPTTFDAFILGRTWAGWVEFKKEEQLQKLTDHNPNHYRLGDDGHYHCPPGEDYAAKYGLQCRVLSSADIDWVYQRNLLWMEAYLRKKGNLTVPTEAEECVLNLLQSPTGLPLSELLMRATNATADHIYTMVAAGRIYMDLRLTPIAEIDRMRVFRDPAMARAYAMMHALPTEPANGTHAIQLRAGEHIVWRETPWIIASVTASVVDLMNEEEVATVPLPHFLQFVTAGVIRGLPEQSRSSAEKEAQQLLARATAEDIDAALNKARVVQAYQSGERVPDGNIHVRMIQRYVARWKEGIDRYGRRYAYVNLLSRVYRRGNRLPKLEPAVEEELKAHVAKCTPQVEGVDNTVYYEKLDGGTITRVWGDLCNVCVDKGLTPPTLETFRTHVKARPRYEQEKNLRGPRAAYNLEPLYLELESTTPRHGDRAFEVGHIDHSPGDVELFCPKTGKNLGTCWFTFLVDAYTRRILAIYIAFHPPNYVSCMMVIRECVRRFGRLPDTIVVDGAPEFRSTYLDRLIARYEKHKRTRPKANPRHGSVCERVFGTTMTQLLHNLEGNTEVRRYTRQVTKGVDPKRNGCWTLLALYLTLYAWADLVYDRAEHAGILQSPADAFAESMRVGGVREHQAIPYDDDFIFSTFPSTPKGTARVQDQDGIKVNSIYYWTKDDAFRTFKAEGTDVKVVFDPLDVSHVFAYVAGEWRECLAKHYYHDFKGRTVAEIDAASKELHARMRLQNSRATCEVNARNLAAYLREIKDVEVELKKLRNAEDKSIYSSIIQSLGHLAATGTTGTAEFGQTHRINTRAHLTLVGSGNDEEDDAPLTDEHAELTVINESSKTTGIDPATTDASQDVYLESGVTSITESKDDLCEEYE
jgi:putative transposase